MKIGIISSHELALKLMERMEKRNDFLCGTIGEVLEGKYFSTGPEKLMQSLLAELWPGWANWGHAVGYMQMHDPWANMPGGSLALRLAFLNRILQQPDRQLCWLKREAS